MIKTKIGTKMKRTKIGTKMKRAKNGTKMKRAKIGTKTATKIGDSVATHSLSLWPHCVSPGAQRPYFVSIGVHSWFSSPRQPPYDPPDTRPLPALIRVNSRLKKATLLRASAPLLWGTQAGQQGKQQRQHHNRRTEQQALEVAALLKEKE